MGEEEPHGETATENSTTLQAAFKKLKIDPEWNQRLLVSRHDDDSLHRLWAGKRLIGKARSSHDGTGCSNGECGKGCVPHKAARSRTEPYTLDCIDTMQHLSFKSELCTKVNCGCKKSKSQEGWCHASGLLFVPSTSPVRQRTVREDKLRMRNSEKDRKQIIRSAKLRLLREGKGFQARPFFPFGTILKKGRSPCPAGALATTDLPVFGAQAEPSPDFGSVHLSVRHSAGNVSPAPTHGSTGAPPHPLSSSVALGNAVLFTACPSRPPKRPVEATGGEATPAATTVAADSTQQGLKRKSPSRLKSLPCAGRLDRKHGKSCSQQAKISVEDFSVNELASYFENYVYIPKKMSSMAEMMYT